MSVAEALRVALRDLDSFSRYALRMPLRPYQREAGMAVVDSVRSGKGLTFVVMMARQSGKNELSAHLETYLLALYQRQGGTIVKCAPTMRPQLLTSRQRLEGHLEKWLTAGRWRPVDGQRVSLGRASVLFLSAHPAANVVGATASLLLEVDEAQDVDVEKYLKDFRPMAATSNATTVLYGTAWAEDSLLEQQRRQCLADEARDGVRRCFSIGWEEVARYNEAYRRFVAAERARLGEEHPLFRTQYQLQSLAGEGRFLSAQQVAQLAGGHTRLRRGREGVTYVAGVDIAGEDEETTDAAVRALHPSRDSTVITVAALDHSWCDAVRREPALLVVEHYYWTGRRHAEQYAGMLDVLRTVFPIAHLAIDASGVGAAPASFLATALGRRRVTPVVFTAPTKSHLAYSLLAAVNAGRLKVYREDGSEESREFWRQCAAARYEVRGNQLMNFYVSPAEGHDDFLISLALCVEAAAQVKRTTALGKPGPRSL